MPKPQYSYLFKQIDADLKIYLLRLMNKTKGFMVKVKALMKNQMFHGKKIAELLQRQLLTIM